MNSLYDAYIHGDPEIRAHYAHAPEQVFKVRGDAPPWDPDLLQALAPYQHDAGASKTPLSGREWVIATGQQSGLFTGPLYTIYKAVTAIKLADRLTQDGVPCVPVFWVAGDDHDFEEVRTAHFLTRGHKIASMTYTPRDENTGAPLRIADLPMHRVPLTSQLHALINDAAHECRNSEQTSDVCAFLHASVDKAHSVSEWFALLMGRLFADTRLQMFTPTLPAARQAAAPILRHEIMHPLASETLLHEQGLRLAALGHEIPIQRSANACNFFLEVGGRRKKVIYRKHLFRIAGTDLSYTADAMLALLEASPGRFSPNVALRPIVQQHLFPVAAYVAGPGEVAYWAQLKPLFAFFETPMPVVYPRARGVIHTLKTQQLLRQYGVDLRAVQGNHDLLASALRATGGNPALQALCAQRGDFEASLSEVAHAVTGAAQHDAVAKAVARFEGTTRRGLDRLDRRLLHADRDRRQTVEARLERLRNTITPLKKPQERVLSVFSFLFEHGWPLMERLKNELDENSVALQEIVL